MGMQVPGLAAGNMLARLARIMLPAGALPTLSFGIPPVDLTGSLAIMAYWVAESGGTSGIPLIALLLTVVLVGRIGLSWKQRMVETLVVLLAVLLLLGGGAYVNENIVKPALAVPRPNILELATAPPSAPLLQMTTESFYALPDKAARSSHLQKVLTPEGWLNERVRGHWIAETGYSFPSGHAFAAMMFATFFLAMGLSCCVGKRLWVFYLAVPWAIAVCFSRPILRVHSPTDVCIGAVEGIVVGVLAFLVVRRVLAAVVPQPASHEGAGAK